MLSDFFLYLCNKKTRGVCIQEELSYERDKICFYYRGKGCMIGNKVSQVVRVRKDVINDSVKIKETSNHFHSRYISFTLKYIIGTH